MIEIIALFIGASSALISAAALGYVIHTFRINRNQLNFAVIINCTERFQRIMGLMKSDDEAARQKAIKRYIDLCNEELFYFKNKFIPDEVADEWIDGMIYYLPHIVHGVNVNNNDVANLINLEDLKNEYPRAFSALQFSNLYHDYPIPTRPQLIFHLKANIAKTAAIPDIPLHPIEGATNTPQLKE